MKFVTAYLDPISPFAYLGFERWPQVLEGCSYSMEIRPVLFAALLKAQGNLGPAEIEPKRQWTFRHVHWIAQAHGIPLATPATHPFNPLPLLRLWLAAGPNRLSGERVLRHVWAAEGAEANDPARLAALREQLQPGRDPDGEAVKAELRAHTDAALAAGAFGVPSFVLHDAAGGDRLFWGLDALPMLRAALRDEPWFDGPAWAAAAAARPGVRRA